MKKRKKGYFQVYQLTMFIGMIVKKNLKRKFHLIVTQSVFCNVIFFNIFKFNNLEQNNAIKILTSTKKDESNFNNKTFYKTNNNTNIYSNFRTDSLNINSEKYASIKNNKLDNNFFFNKTFILCFLLYWHHL